MLVAKNVNAKSYSNLLNQSITFEVFALEDSFKQGDIFIYVNSDDPDEYKAYSCEEVHMLSVSGKPHCVLMLQEAFIITPSDNIYEKCV